MKSLLTSRDALVQELEATVEQNEKLAYDLSLSNAQRDAAVEKNEELALLLEEAESTLEELKAEAKELRQDNLNNREMFRTFSDIRGQDLSIIIGKDDTKDSTSSVAKPNLSPFKRAQSFSDSESDCCDSEGSSVTHVKDISKKRKLENPEEKVDVNNNSERKSDCQDDALSVSDDLSVEDFKDYARDKIENFSDSESDSDESDSETPSLVCSKRRKTLDREKDERQAVDVIRSHGFYGSVRSPLQAPDSIKVKGHKQPSKSLLGTLGRYFGLGGTNKSKNTSSQLLSSMITAPPVPENLKCTYLHQDWNDGRMMLTWDAQCSQGRRTNEPPVSPVRESPKKKQRINVDNEELSHIMYEVQRSVSGGGEGNFEEVGATPRCHMSLEVNDCPTDSLVSVRVRAVDSQTRAKSLWSTVCSVTTPAQMHSSTSHSLEYPVRLNDKESAVSVKFGDNGVLSYLGTAGDTEQYHNPLKRGLVQVEVSCKWYQTDVSIFVEKFPTEEQLRMEDYCRFCKPCSSMILDLGEDRRLLPTAYSLRGFLKNKFVLKSWQLEGSNDKNATKWTVLLRHYKDTNAVRYDKEKKVATGSWTLPRLNKSFRFFRLYQLDPTASYLECSGIELYGSLTIRNNKHFRGKLVGDIYIAD